MTNQIKTLLFLGVLSAILITFGSMLGPGYIVPFTLLTVAMNFGAYFYSDRVVLRMNNAREVSKEEAPRLHAIVEELSQRAGLPKPKVCIIPQPHANAFATGRNPQHGVVAVTEGIMRLLSERELKGVIAHELAHIKNRDILLSTIASTMAGVITALGRYAMFFGGRSNDDEGGGAGQSLVMMLVAPLAATLLQLAVSRSREYLADATGAEICGDPHALASALAKLHHGAEAVPGDVAPATASMFIINPFAGLGGITQLFSTHPPVERRIERLEALSGPQRMAV